MKLKINETLQDHMNQEYYNKNLCHGGKTSFTTRDILKVHNKFMLALLYAFDSKLIDLANYCGVNPGTVINWIYGGSYPKFINRQILLFYFNIPENVLFSNYAINNASGIMALRAANKGKFKLTSNKSGKIKKPLIYGLLWVYRVSPLSLAKKIGIDPKMMERILYTDKDPGQEIKNKFAAIFEIPSDILFMENLRSRTQEQKEK